jgi:hypothetical protein
LASVVRSSKKPSGIAGALGLALALAAGLPAAPPASRKPVAADAMIDGDGASGR